MTHAARELALYADNTFTIYHHYIQPTIANLKKHIARGRYDPEKAVKAFYNVAVASAKMYVRDFATHSDWYKLFTTVDRTECARALLERYEDEIHG